MKKLFLVSALALFGAMNAQSGFKAGVHVGLPVGDAGDAYSFNIGVDASYMWPVADSFSAGVTTGYSAFLGKTVDIPFLGSYKYETLGLVPIAATAAYKFTPEFSLSADLGYGFTFGGGNSDGGFYYQPKVSYTLNEKHDISLGYQGVSKNGASLSSINLGYAYNFGK